MLFLNSLHKPSYTQINEVGRKLYEKIRKWKNNHTPPVMPHETHTTRRHTLVVYGSAFQIRLMEFTGRHNITVADADDDASCSLPLTKSTTKTAEAAA